MPRNICSLCTVISAILSVIIPSKGVVLDCYTTTVSKYDGHQQTSKDEQPCLRWDQFETYSASDFPDATRSDAANFCRSPAGYNESWCFTTDQGDWQPCGITKCEKRDSRVDYHKHEDDIVFSRQNPEVRPLGNLSQNAHALENEAEVPVYSQPVKKNTTEDSDNTYAQVINTGKSASSSKTEKPQHAQDGQLLYADLAFDPNETPSKAAVAKRRDSPTEYADIDYVKTKNNKGIDYTPTEPDNIYANQ